jgi:hypothetical protein
MFIRRALEAKILEIAHEYPVVSIIGPRQSGKTTLSQQLFPHHRYISLEDPDIRLLAETDPRLFLSDYPSDSGIILDEIQRAPHLLSYIQTIVDREKKNGFFIVTGSQNFLVDEAITQTLAGRMAVVTLLPLSIQELKQAALLPDKLEEFVYKGGYPKLYAQDMSVERLYANYIRLYVERDVRTIKNVENLNTFQRFMQLCAGRTGQILNLTSLGNDCGVNHNTIKAWISLLQASYIVFLLYPYHKNFGKRVIKSPKLYFVDTGLVCSLLKISSPADIVDHYLRGSLVETCIISDLLKQQYNLDQQPSLYFWRDNTGHEVDCVVDRFSQPIGIEIKAGRTVNNDFFKDIKYWQDLTSTSAESSFVVYGGKDNQSWPTAKVLGWSSSSTLLTAFVDEQNIVGKEK